MELAEVIENNFSLRDADWASLFSYLQKRPQVLPVLIDAPNAIRNVFGDVRPWLDLVTDPEEGWNQLFIVVPTAESALQMTTLKVPLAVSLLARVPLLRRIPARLIGVGLRPEHVWDHRS